MMKIGNKFFITAYTSIDFDFM